MLPVMLDALPAPRYLCRRQGWSLSSGRPKAGPGDADALRDWLIERGTTPVTPNKDHRKFLHPFNAKRYKSRNAIERMFCRLKDFRRIASQPDTTDSPATTSPPYASQFSSYTGFVESGP